MLARKRHSPILALLLLPLGAVAGATDQPPVKIDSEQLLEGSGLAASRRPPGVFWTHNDPGDSARLFAIDRQGRVLGDVLQAAVR